MNLPDDYVYMKNWCGPSWDSDDKWILWQIDSQWSEKRIRLDSSQHEHIERVLTMHQREMAGEPLSRDEYLWLAKHGYVKTCGEWEGEFKSSWQIVVISNPALRDRLLELGERIKKKYKQSFDEWKQPYVKALLESVPVHLRRMEEYETQFIFHADGWFLLHCIVTLLNNGKLTPPTEGQKRALSTLILPL
jgi:hypothetical protein